MVFDGTRLPGVRADSILMSKIENEDIDSIRVLKGSRARAEYGSDARHGVILIYLKKQGNAP
jgi:outer membrane cobalamin receptor